VAAGANIVWDTVLRTATGFVMLGLLVKGVVDAPVPRASVVGGVEVEEGVREEWGDDEETEKESAMMAVSTYENGTWALACPISCVGFCSARTG